MRNPVSEAAVPPAPDRLKFTGSFTQQAPLPQASIDGALDVLMSSRLHRYNTVEGDAGVTARLEETVATWQGRKYCLAVTSGGQAIQIALRAAGVRPGDAVLVNAFTLAPVPGAIEAVGGRAVLVETGDDLRPDLHDLETRVDASGARFLLLSHMRGHAPDMGRLMALADRLGLTVIEDCAHSMGGWVGGVRSGNHGRVACFSSQTYKHVNSGEGGFLVSDDPDLMARATILSGSYMLYARHGASPPEDAFRAVREVTPNLSARMDALRAAVILPQIAGIDHNVAEWNRRHDALADAFRGANRVALPGALPGELRVGSSFQFRVPDFGPEDCARLVRLAAEDGVELKWFGAPEPHGFTSTHKSWRYLEDQSLPNADRVLATLFDMRLPLTFSVEDCRLIGRILLACIEDVATGARKSAAQLSDMGRD
ncbi:aminotransferase class I/II-fold pyridoxal phosphate-dependent enzyme [Alphaproteobacteria bacterium GH1-50]|uniref:Aminotransferase class I/II-fold pyridoxal phosphate-dependent enzyme n=1 Tax=Kangsaoukella pontilimi TaxID=2691042 RepID=A0A7C9MIQ1_9RHOB|nr:aminotransferase class I/II-fold pyridoxal phosphate-dependent enzyme [Kangsaoukella pontilimi]MXQ07135.1 aminotransferase class I/II-fold pyridoxal phosphate-dependent enzyme [Kangsaoukella pontilimi]